MPIKNLSPHVQIYKFPITAVTSILNRVTGLSLSGMYIGGSFIPYTYKDIQPIYDSLSIYSKNTINSVITFPIIYHSFGGLRHFIWDKYPYFLTNTKTTKSSYILIGL